MTDRRKIATRVAIAAGVVIVAVVAVLIVGQVIVMSRSPAEAARLAELEERVRADAEVAVELEAERELQTAGSLAREHRNRRLGYLLLVTAAVFVVAAKAAVISPSPAGKGFWEMRTPEISSPAPSRKVALDVGAPRQTLDLSAVDEIVAHAGGAREATIPILQALQENYRYLPEPALRRVCEITEITPAQIAGVASFYAQFRRTPMGEHRVRVCHGTACHVAGVGPIMDELRRRLEIPPGKDTDAGQQFTLDPVACLGCCSLAPVLMVDDDVSGRLTPLKAWEALGGGEA